MTSIVKVTSCNYPVRVETWDTYADKISRLTDVQILTPEDGERQYYCTTSRELRITDLEYDDPQVKGEMPNS